MKNYLLLLLLSFYMIGCTTAVNDNSNERKEAMLSDTLETQLESIFKCNYLNEKTPDSIPIKFGDNLISTGKDESSFEISSDGNTIIFSREGKIILLNYNEDSKSWTEPARAPFSHSNDGECCFSPDGKKIYFNSLRPCSSSKQFTNIWISEKENGKWSDAYYSKLSIGSKSVHAVSVASNGNVYTDGVIKIEKSENGYLPSKKLAENINGNHVFIAPDESYILFDKRLGSQYYILISFSNNDGTWTGPIKLNENINDGSKVGNPFITTDGKFMFFMKKFDIYWVKADFIDKLRPQS